VVDRIKRQVLLSLLLPDERLPAERKLSLEMNISRVTLREALRILETEGFVVVRRGTHGGTFVADEERLNEIARRIIGKDPAVILRALEYRDINEAGAVRLACTRRTPTDLRRMRIGLEAMGTAQSATFLRRAENTFHIALAEAAHNSFLAKGLEDALVALFVPYGDEIQGEERGLRFHARQALIDAIEARNSDKALQLCQNILTMERRLVRQYAKAA
jgi:DNA-binding FadR family transcriptional regulator